MPTLAFAVAPLLPAGCAAGAVAVEPPSPPPAARTACAELSERLPTVVDGASARDTDPGSDLTAAWGDPAIVLRCGVAEPAGEALGNVVAVDGVDWAFDQLDDGYRFTTTGRTAAVEVEVPDAYAPEVNPLTDLADAVGAVPPAP